MWIVLLGLSLAASPARALHTVTLAWNANSETNIGGYKLYYGTATRAYTNVVNVGNVTTFSIPDLVEGVTYFFAVTAYNTLGAESDFSTEAVASGTFRVESLIRAVPTGYTITWASTPGAVYRVRARTSLATTNWNVRSPSITAVATTTAWTDSNLGSAAARFYLIERLPQ